MPHELIHALALVKRACASVNGELGLLPAEKATAISAAAEVAKRPHQEDGTLREAALALGYATKEELYRWLDPATMLGD